MVLFLPCPKATTHSEIKQKDFTRPLPFETWGKIPTLWTIEG